MYERILVATDGTALSAPAIRAAVGLAKSLHAKLAAIYVVAPFAEGAMTSISMLKGFRRELQKDARRALAAFDAEARSRGVAAKSSFVAGREPWLAILRAARDSKCDLIVMASHGRSGLSGLLLGSETTKVLTHTKIPVLVCR
jgi:nucleotide-binding universal stress UspA family protein